MREVITESFTDINVGDAVNRYVDETMLMKLKVTRIDEQYIYCGDWKFSRRNGAEIDEDLGWSESKTGSYLKK